MISNSASDVIPKPLKIGLICNSMQVSSYVLDVVTWAKNEPNIEINYFISHIDPLSVNHLKVKSRVDIFLHSVKKNGVRGTIANFLLLMLRGCEHLWLKKNESFKNHLNSYNIIDLGLSVLELSPIVSKAGYVHQFSEEDINKVKLLELDLILQCGDVIYQGSILRASKLGLLSFHYGNNHHAWGTPVAFWEVLKRQDTTNFFIQQLTEELNNKNVLFRGQLKTKGYWLLNQANIYSKANYYLKEFIKKLSSTKEIPSTLPVFPYSDRLYLKPGISDIFRYISKTIVRKTYSLIKLKPKWHVAFVHSDWRDAVLWRCIDFPSMPGKSLADPFLYSKGGHDYCFAEEIDLVTSLGSIVVYELFLTHAVRLGTACKENFHLSFPFLFEYDGQVFMLPESHQNRDIRIYECIDFPLQWKLKHVVMSNISAADSLLINKENKWWLFTNIDHWSGDDHCEELAIFSADNPFSTEWSPHSLNPIYVNASCARNGGVFKSENKFYRVSQNQGFNIYGKSVVINEITDLTENSFHEDSIVEIYPYFKKNILGTHHFHTNGSITVFDYYK